VVILKLIRITEKGAFEEQIAGPTDIIKEIISLTADLYANTGYVPRIGYLVFDKSRRVGTCAFKAPPQGNCVEIAYFTFPEYEGKGIATRMSQALVKIAL
jgi:RimJ/RimL family protein N-acetyltransferase